MAPSQPRLKDIPKNLKPYFLALFRPAERWNQTEGANDLPVRQLAFLRAGFEAGTYRLAGPITDGGEIAAMALIEAENIDEARRIAGVIASKAPLAVTATKRAIREGAALPLDEGLALEALHFGTMVATNDFREGTRAFLDKRKPAFEGR